MKLEIFPIEGIKEVDKGDDVADLILASGFLFEDFDVVVVTQKIISKAEGQVIELKKSDTKLDIAKRESVKILRKRGDLIISETKHGFICANAGVDFSNIEAGKAALLPEDPDVSALRIQKSLEASARKKIAVIISDTFGRPWRRGLTNVAIGCAGIQPIIDLIGTTDSFGMELNATEIAIVDELAGATEIVMGKSKNIPVAVVRGLEKDFFGSGNVKDDLVRKAHEDFFR